MAVAPARVLRSRLRVRECTGLRGAACVWLGWVLCGVGVLVAQKPTPLPVQLERARERLELMQPGTPQFHLELQFQSTSEITGAVSHGTLTEDWWNDQWWRQVFVVNGLRRERVQVAGTLFQDEDESYVLPLRSERVLAAFLSPFPTRGEPASLVEERRIDAVQLQCLTMPQAAQEHDMNPAAEVFCVDRLGDLRATVDPNFRVLYNDMVDFGPRRVPGAVLLVQKKKVVASVHRLALSMWKEGPVALQQMGVDDQIRLALARPRAVQWISPMRMQSEMESLDARMIPQAMLKLQPGQRYAVVQVLEAGGKLLDGEVLGSSDEAAAALARHVVQQTKFRAILPHLGPLPFQTVLRNPPPTLPTIYAGTVLLAVPLGQ